jgi:hypothetical protein
MQLVPLQQGSHHRMTPIEENVQNIKDMHPGWNVIFDDDVTCMDKIMLTGYFEVGEGPARPETFVWFSQKKPKTKGIPYHTMMCNRALVYVSRRRALYVQEVGEQRTRQWYAAAPGKLKSDLCRLAQLHLAGGAYMDNDLQLKKPLEQILKPSDTFVSVWAMPDVSALTHKVQNDGVVFQAFMAAAKGSPVVERGLALFRNHVAGAKLVRHHDLGTALMGQALKDVGYQRSDRRRAPTKHPYTIYLMGVIEKGGGGGGGGGHGVRMLKELSMNIEEMSRLGRTDGGSCGIAVKEEDGIDAEVLAFSRVAGGLYKSNPAVTRSLKGAWFQPLSLMK